MNELSVAKSLRRRGHVVLGPATLRLLDAVCNRHAAGRSCSLRSLALAAKIHYTNIHGKALRLRRLGLVTWEEGKVGTLRPTCRIELFDSGPPRV